MMCVIYPYPPPSIGGGAGGVGSSARLGIVRERARVAIREKARIGIGYHKTTIARNRGTTAPAGRVLRSGTFA